ncbi:MAG: hypothetical protein EA353_13985 [Puniceicoccaceae bacterium]|nr:MAG: hypothetical protein EA353_13985 [Puniceicoccaceae bacterium]
MRTLDVAGSRTDPFHEFRETAPSAAFDAAGQPRAAYASIVELMRECSKSDLVQRQRRLNHAIEELGLQFSDAAPSRRSDNPWRLDLFPLSIDAEAWQRISRGVVQRALAFNAFAQDLYTDQNILRDKVIPHDLVLRDPAFLRELSGIDVPNGEYSQFGAFDLVDAGEGDWQIIEHHMGAPFGVSHVLQNRRILSQVFPELYERADVAPVAGFSTYLLEMLRAQSKKKNPHVLLLTHGQPGQAYFEEAFIARHMGISIAQPRDLLVRDSQVYLKTIRGLELVDVIYRRVESSALDPIAVPHASARGVPGLMNVWRQGNVAIVNAPGAGVADNRGLLRYSDRIINRYLNETPILRSVETYHLGDIDQLEYVSEHLDDWALKPLQDHERIWQLCGERPGPGAASLQRLARRKPEYFVVQNLPEPAPLPQFKEGEFSPNGAYLRVFYILGKEPIVLPGGMAQQKTKRPRTRRLGISTDGLKDVWVPDSVVEDVAPKRAPTVSGKRFSISSRVAESLYWAGRYLERAENTARQFHTLERLRWDQMARSEQRTYWPLLQAVAAATGQSELTKKKQPPRDTLALSKSLLLDANEGASVRACIRNARNALENVREVISPECREVLEDISLFLNQASKRMVTRGRLAQLCQGLVSEVARFNGTAERTMPHDDSWQFFRVGVFFERGVGTLALLKVAMPRILETYHEADEESTDLTALLRLLGSLDAYRREFRSRAYIDRILSLILKARYVPSSVNFCLRNLDYAIGTLASTGQHPIGAEIQSQIRSLLEELDSFPLAQERFGEVERLDSGEVEPSHKKYSRAQTAEAFAGLSKQLESLHERIEDIFFSHQDVFTKEPTLFELE